MELNEKSGRRNVTDERGSDWEISLPHLTNLKQKARRIGWFFSLAWLNAVDHLGAGSVRGFEDRQCKHQILITTQEINPVARSPWLALSIAIVKSGIVNNVDWTLSFPVACIVGRATAPTNRARPVIAARNV